MRWLIRLIATTYYSRTRDQQEIVENERRKYRKLGLESESGLKKLELVLERDIDLDSISSHLVLFAPLSLSKRKFSDILEIGTYRGATANLLAKLFPKANVTTVDLPASDPIFLNTYHGARGTKERHQIYQHELSCNIALENITYIETNTFFLSSVLDGQFDMIWLDGGHKYPEVAWDACQAYELCRPGGLIVFDDIVPEQQATPTDKVSRDAHEVLTYIQKRTECKVTLLLKRLGPQFNSISSSKKYIAILEKPDEALVTTH